MGVDLYLLPFHSDSYFSHSILEVNRRKDLWPKIMALPQDPVPPNFTSYLGIRDGVDGRCYDLTLQTPYGQRLTYTINEFLWPLVNEPGVQECWDNKAVWAYLKECPPNMHVALYWH